MEGKGREHRVMILGAYGILWVWVNPNPSVTHPNAPQPTHRPRKGGKKLGGRVVEQASVGEEGYPTGI